jgi:predicted nucleic acid-binding protein
VNVVVDTSVWVDFFRGRDITLLEEALSEGRVVLPPIVVSDLVSGARRARDMKALRDFLDDLPVHPTPREHWVNVGLLKQLAKTRGIAISTPDAHVAQTALDLSAPLLSRDTVFSRISALSGLQVVSGSR